MAKSGAQYDGLLNRCLLGCLELEVKEKPTLADIRRWSTTLWKNTFRVNIYEMNEDRLLFEFPNRHMAEQVFQGKWSWKKINLKLEWWSEMAGCISNAMVENKIWIRAIRIPLHLWLNKVFQETGKICGGWVATEEETELRNHMKWAGILVANDRRYVPREVSITQNGLEYFFPNWVESKTKAETLSELVGGATGEEGTEEYPVHGR